MLKLNFPSFVPIINAFFLENCHVPGSEPGCKNPGVSERAQPLPLGAAPTPPPEPPLRGVRRAPLSLPLGFSFLDFHIQDPTGKQTPRSVLPGAQRK